MFKAILLVLVEIAEVLVFCCVVKELILEVLVEIAEVLVFCCVVKFDMFVAFVVMFPVFTDIAEALVAIAEVFVFCCEVKDDIADVLVFC